MSVRSERSFVFAPKLEASVKHDTNPCNVFFFRME